jgi:hypothetical protein
MTARGAFVFLVVASAAAALCAPPVTAQQAQGTAAMKRGALTIRTPSGTREIGLTQIESLGLRSVTTRSPWEAGAVQFEGVLFHDLLRHVGLEEAASVIVTARDGYQQMIPREDWADWPLLLATRQDGKPLTGSKRGPTRLVYPISDHPELESPTYDPRWIWAIESVAGPAE